MGFVAFCVVFGVFEVFRVCGFFGLVGFLAGAGLIWRWGFWGIRFPFRCQAVPVKILR